MSLIRPRDKMLATIFLISLLACVIALIVISFFKDVDITWVATFLAAPFFLAGIFVYIQYKKWIYILALIGLDVAMYFLGVSYMIIFFISFAFVGAAGVVGIVVLLQRVLFYRVINSVEYINIKDKLSIGDKVVLFLFNIPRDLDTRTVTINYNLKRASIPWNEMAETMSLGLMLGMFLWIYILMNPAFMDTTTLQDTPAFMFSLVLFIPLLVLPFAVFKSLNARVETRYRDFKLYDGVKETLKRMAVPIFASFMFILLAINEISIGVVVAFIVMSVVFNVVIIGLTSLFFYFMFEAPLVDDIVSKWKVFRPVEMLMDVGNDVKSVDNIPATPKRDLTDYGKLEFTVAKKK